MSYLQNITRYKGIDNLGGIIDIRVARKSEIVSIPEPVNGIIYGEPVLAAGKSFVQWIATPESPKIKSNAKLSREGTARTNSIEFIVPRDRPELQQMFAQASEDEFILLYRYPNATWKLFGSIDCPVQFEYDHDSGSAYADRNEYGCRFYYEGPDNRYFYNYSSIPGDPATAPPGPAPVVVRVNGQVVASLTPGQSIDFDTDFEFDFLIVGTS